MRKEIKNWWEQAKRDLKSAHNSYNSNDFYIASFLSQQAIEKGLKALYLKKKNFVKKIHNIVTLAKELKLPINLIEDCDKVNPVYTDTRYPDAKVGLPSERYTKERSKEDIEIAERILKWLEEKI